MKKLGILVMPLMAISLLASCNGGAPKIETFTVTFDANGGTLDSGASPSIDVKDGTLFSEIPNIAKQTATKDADNFNFYGWGLSEHTPDKIKDDFKITDNLTVYAIYTPEATATVTFSSDSANCKLLYEGQKVAPGIPYTVPAVANITLTLVVDYNKFLPVFDDGKGLIITGASTQQFDAIKQEIRVSIPGNGNCNIKATTDYPKTSLEEYKWSEISQISEMNLAKNYFKIYNPNNHPELSTKKVQLKHQDTADDGTDVITEGELYQTVRIIGFNEDYTELPEPREAPDPDKSIGITFEFADLISDENGYSLATYWNDTNATEGSNYSYKDSTIRKALNGTTNDINWFRYYGEGADTPGTGENRKFASDPNYKKSILSMLPDELTKDGILKTTSKYININNGDGWKEEIVNDKLFLLSPFEMGSATRSDFEEAHTTTYSYYKGAEDSKRIKKQIKGDEGARTDSVYGSDLDGKYKGGYKYSCAGYNNPTEGNGGDSWLRSPRTDSSDYAWIVIDDGYLLEFNVYYNAYGAAPAFCI